MLFGVNSRELLHNSRELSITHVNYDKSRIFGGTKSTYFTDNSRALSLVDKGYSMSGPWVIHLISANTVNKDLSHDEDLS